MPDNGLARFDRWMEGRGRSPFTRYGYVLDILQFAQWFVEWTGVQLAPERVTASIVMEYGKHVVSMRGNKPRTFNRKLAALRAYVLWAQMEGVTKTDPLDGMHMMQEQRAPPRWLERVEVNAMKHAARQAVEVAVGHSAQVIAVRDRAMFMMILDVGLRLGEMCAINLSDVEIAKSSMLVHVTTTNVVRPRTIPISPAAHPPLLDWLGLRPETRSSALFINITSKSRIARRSAQTRIQALAERAGVNASAQVLRHTFAKRLFDSGTGLKNAAVLLGHSDLYTTRLYTNSKQKEHAPAGGMKA